MAIPFISMVLFSAWILLHSRPVPGSQERFPAAILEGLRRQLLPLTFHLTWMLLIIWAIAWYINAKFLRSALTFEELVALEAWRKQLVDAWSAALNPVVIIGACIIALAFSSWAFATRERAARMGAPATKALRTVIRMQPPLRMAGILVTALASITLTGTTLLEKASAFKFRIQEYHDEVAGIWAVSERLALVEAANAVIDALERDLGDERVAEINQALDAAWKALVASELAVEATRALNPYREYQREEERRKASLDGLLLEQGGVVSSFPSIASGGVEAILFALRNEWHDLTDDELRDRAEKLREQDRVLRGSLSPLLPPAPDGYKAQLDPGHTPRTSRAATRRASDAVSVEVIEAQTRVPPGLLPGPAPSMDQLREIRSSLEAAIHKEPSSSSPDLNAQVRRVLFEQVLAGMASSTAILLPDAATSNPLTKKLLEALSENILAATADRLAPLARSIFRRALNREYPGERSHDLPAGLPEPSLDIVQDEIAAWIVEVNNLAEIAPELAGGESGMARLGRDLKRRDAQTRAAERAEEERQRQQEREQQLRRSCTGRGC